jgi:hypothetical protein
MSLLMFMYAEKSIGDKWELIGEMESAEEYYIDDVKTKPIEIFKEDYCNYNLYAILANVNNDYNSDKEKYEYISVPRGIPNNACEIIKKWKKALGEDVNYPSWLYIDEIIRFDWNQKVVKIKMVDRKYAPLFKGESYPFPYKEWPDEIISYSEYHRDGVEVAWTENYAESVGANFMEFLKTIVRKENPKKARVVFWFS